MSRFNTSVQRVCKCDGYLGAKGIPLYLLMEYKFDKSLENVNERAKVIAQAIAYYKAIIDTQDITHKPNMIFIGDVNECFAFHANFIKKYIAYDLDWDISPCKMGECTELVQAITSDHVLNENIFVSYPQKENFDDICFQMESQAKNNKLLIAITKNTIRLAFDYFCKKVLGDTCSLDANTKVGVFMDAIKHFKERKIEDDRLITKNYAPVKVDNISTALAYFTHFGENDEKELKKLETYFDFLVEDDSRRRDGFFITPKIFVDKAHDMINQYMTKSGVLDWYKDCLVWDTCCGTKSLTRDYEFSELFLSTLQDNELKSSTGSNTEAKATFVYDFLNDSSTKLPENLKNSLKYAKVSGKKVVFIMNPPYAQAGGEQGHDSKAGVKRTFAAMSMAKEFAKASNELCVQFLYRVDEICSEYKLNKGQVIIAAFTKPTWMCGDSFEPWRKYWLSKYSFNSGMLFNASEFADCCDRWGVSFSIWTNTSSTNKNSFLHTIYENNADELTILGTHNLYNLDGRVTINTWCKGKNPPKQIKCIGTSDGIKMRKSNSENNRASICSDNLGYLYSQSSNVCNAMQRCALFSTAFCSEHGFSITPENFDRVCATFTARKSIKNTWIITRDMYSQPDITNPEYLQYLKDSYVYSMFNAKSDQTSVSGLVEGESYDFVNQFYPFSKKETYNMLGKEIKTNFHDESRFIKQSGRLDNLTESGSNVLSLFKSCIVKSAYLRDKYGNTHPELQVDRWDCGWRQLKDLFIEACPNEFNALRMAYSDLEKTLVQRVYDLGFLQR